MKFFLKINETALHLAVKNKNLNIIKALLSFKGIDINTKDAI